MAKPSRWHRGGRVSCIVSFDMPSYPPTKAELRGFIQDALESMGGSRHPDDSLFHSLGQVTVKFQKKEPAK
jgi:hypothetical protein